MAFPRFWKCEFKEKISNKIFLCESECVFDNVEFEAIEELENCVVFFAELSFFVN